MSFAKSLFFSSIMTLSCMGCVDSSIKETAANDPTDPNDELEEDQVVVRVDPPSATLRVGWKQRFSAKVVKIDKDGNESEVEQEVEWSYPGLGGVLTPTSEAEADIIAQGIPGPFNLRIRSVAYPDAFADATVLINPLGFNFPPSIPIPGNDDHGVFGDLAIGGPEEDPSIFVAYVQVQDDGSGFDENSVKRYRLSEFDENAIENATIFNPFCTDTSPTSVLQAVRVTADQQGACYWLAADFDDIECVNRRIERLRPSSDGSGPPDAFDIGTIDPDLQFDLQSDIAVDSKRVLYVMVETISSPVLTRLFRIKNAFNPNRETTVDLVIDDRGEALTPRRFVADAEDRLLVITDAGLERWTIEEDATTVTATRDADFAPPAILSMKDVVADPNGLIYVVSQDKEETPDLEPPSFASSVHVLNGWGTLVGHICKVEDIKWQGRFESLHRIVGLTVDPAGCLIFFDDVNWSQVDDPFNSSTSHFIRLDPLVLVDDPDRDGSYRDDCND